MLSVLALVLTSAKTTDLTFVRHGETQANATGKYNSQTLNAFSRKGELGVSALTKQLLGQPKWQVILVSPSPRALKTIAPYLRATHQKATIWPLLYECCTGKRTSSPMPRTLKFGAKIVVPASLAGLFVVEPGHDRLPAAPDYTMGLRQVDDAVKEFMARYAGSRVLLVGHSGQGGHFLHALTGKWQKVDNTKEIHVVLKTP